jgi:hypothetical protein
MDFYDLTVPQLMKTLRNLDTWMKAAEAYAESRKFPVDNLMQARLAPDQFTFVRQVQTVCDNAKFLAGRLAGKEWPAHADNETTFVELHARIAAVQAYLETFKREDFAGAAERRIVLPWVEGKYMHGWEYMTEFAFPNFYFHVVTAYAILRHSGVELGKRDYIGGLPLKA